MILLFTVSAFDSVGIISAMNEELALIRESMKVERVDTIARRTFVVGSIGGVPCVCVQAGVGKVNAAITAEILVSHYGVDAVIFSGVAGGINSGLGIGDIVISEQVLHHDYGAITPTAFLPWDTTGYAADTLLVRIAQDQAKVLHFEALPENICKETKHFPRIMTGRVVTGDQFIASEEKRQWLEKIFRADCVEMEGAAVAQVCSIHRVPFVVIRCLSDLANEHADIDFEMFVSFAAKNSCRLVIGMMHMLK